MCIWTCVDRDHTRTYEKNRQNARGGGQRERVRVEGGVERTISFMISGVNGVNEDLMELKYETGDGSRKRVTISV